MGRRTRSLSGLNPVTFNVTRDAHTSIVVSERIYRESERQHFQFRFRCNSLTKTKTKTRRRKQNVVRKRKKNAKTQREREREKERSLSVSSNIPDSGSSPLENASQISLLFLSRERRAWKNSEDARDFGDFLERKVHRNTTDW